MAKVNCAIYTRKSTEEGLEQDFNSLDNQFESAKAYIKSQKHENWKFYKRYDDGGFTGANTKRPGLTQLLEDIEKGFVQVVVVYKVEGMWMGGNVPHGYKLKNKKLYIEHKEAQEIKYIFQSYLNCSSILELQKQLSKEGFKTRSGKPWLHGTLGKVLNNPTYIGKVKHKDKIFEGQ